jgi:hypothetical protein
MNIEYMNIAQLKSLHKKEVAALKQMRESKVLPRINIELFSEQKAFAIQQQQAYVDLLASKIQVLENPAVYLNSIR